MGTPTSHLAYHWKHCNQSSINQTYPSNIVLQHVA